MTDNKIRMLVDVVNEVRKEAPDDVPNWSKRYAEAIVNLKINYETENPYQKVLKIIH